ncbi:hypothetical protein, partial [Pseudomonas protegens]|uniref:hypothetical protein n=1 Tax=Pseudomonas protegens TaxID=380021 RepID=UPI001B32E554
MFDLMSRFWSGANLENMGFPQFFSFSPRLAGAFRIATSPETLQRVVQAHDISLQNLSLSAIAKHPTDPAAGLG